MSHPSGPALGGSRGRLYPQLASYLYKNSQGRDLAELQQMVRTIIVVFHESSMVLAGFVPEKQKEYPELDAFNNKHKIGMP